MQDMEYKKENCRLIRKLDLSNLQKQVNKTLDASNTKYSQSKIGHTARIRITDVDQALSDRRHILTTMIEMATSNFYKLGTK